MQRSNSVLPAISAPKPGRQISHALLSSWALKLPGEHFTHTRPAQSCLRSYQRCIPCNRRHRHNTGQAGMQRTRPTPCPVPQILAWNATGRPCRCVRVSSALDAISVALTLCDVSPQTCEALGSMDWCFSAFGAHQANPQVKLVQGAHVACSSTSGSVLVCHLMLSDDSGSLYSATKHLRR